MPNFIIVDQLAGQVKKLLNCIGSDPKVLVKLSEMSASTRIYRRFLQSTA